MRPELSWYAGFGSNFGLQLDVRESRLFSLLLCPVVVTFTIPRDKNSSAANIALNRLEEVLILVNSLMTVRTEASQGRQLPHMYVGLISRGTKSIEN